MLHDSIRPLPPLAGLLALLEAVRGPTFVEAARRLRISPSALTQQLKAVEAAVGSRLFEPAGRLRRPTAEAVRLVAGLRPHLEGLTASFDELTRPPGELRGTVRIGGPAPFFRWWLRPRLLRLLQEHPAVQAEVRFEVTSRLVAALRGGDLDFAVLGSPCDEDGLSVRVVEVEEFKCLAAPGFLRSLAPPSADVLRGHRWIAFDRDLAMLAPWWRAAFGRREPMPAEGLCHVGNLDEMLALCVAGVGLTALPDYFVTEALKAGDVVEVKPAARSPHGRPARNPLRLAWRRGAVETALFRAASALLTA